MNEACHVLTGQYIKLKPRLCHSDSSWMAYQHTTYLQSCKSQYCTPIKWHLVSLTMTLNIICTGYL